VRWTDGRYSRPLNGAQLPLVEAIKTTSKSIFIAFVSYKPIAEPWIIERTSHFRYSILIPIAPIDADASLASLVKFYPGEQGRIALAEVCSSRGAQNYGIDTSQILFGNVNPSGRTSISWPRNVGTFLAFYNHLKGSRPVNAGYIADDGSLHFGHEVSPLRCNP